MRSVVVTFSCLTWSATYSWSAPAATSDAGVAQRVLGDLLANRGEPRFSALAVGLPGGDWQTVSTKRTWQRRHVHNPPGTPRIRRDDGGGLARQLVN
jgi:hypothetical protein